MPRPGADHGVVQMHADRLRQDRQHAVVIDEGLAAVRLQMEVRLARAVGGDVDHGGGARHQRLGVGTLDDALLVVGIGNAGMDFHGVGRERREAGHVGRQHFEVDLDLLGRGAGMLLGVGGDDGNGVAELEDLLLAQDRAIPAVTLVGREGDEAGDGILAAHVLPRDDPLDARHLLGFRGINVLDQGVADLGLYQCEAQRAGPAS